ncbi:hypothetical protein HPB50_010091 [Hyalomma asiaticum]|uniref:Uncharacterized protein n=1 Tax=Hyalomma asiaticum TaxID=266040 RepID=A0ACB7RNI5_HYAAI|nr:hypothetical protein HPB50_010091 [Hyalomma asiaticum]
MEEATTLELLALQPEQHDVEEAVGATLPPGTLVHIDGDTLVAVVEDGQAIAAATDETAPQLTELDLSSLLSVEEPEEDVLQKALLQADTVVTEEATPEHSHQKPDQQPEAEDQQQQQQQQEQQQQQTVVIDVSSPIELCQNALIVVNGQRCVLQQDASTGQVLAYPIREPKRKRGRPRKVVPPPTEEAPPPAPGEEASTAGPAAIEEEDNGDKGMMEVVTEDGALVRRSCRRRKVARTMQGSNGRRRPRLRKREGLSSSPNNPMQAFLVQMADGQTLMMQIPAASIPAGMDLHQVAQNIATSLNAAAAQQALSGGCLTAESTAASPVLVALQSAISDDALPPPPQPPAPPKRRPGRPRKRPLTPPPPQPLLQVETAGESPVTGQTGGPTDGPTDSVTDNPSVGPAGGSTEGLAGVSEDTLVSVTNGATETLTESPADDASRDSVAAQSVSAVVAQSLEDAVAQVLGPAAGPVTEGLELTTVQQPAEESILPNTTDDATVIPVPEKLVTLLLPKLGASAEEQQQLHCPACEFQAGYLQQLQEHLLSSHADAVVRCRRCPHVCLSRDALIAHYRLQHPRCICPYCDHIGEQAYAIRRHMTRHTQPGACTCPVCGKGYKDPYILKMHIKMVHMPAEVLFECSVCGKKFSRKAHLKRHIRTHNPNKPLKCPLCNYRGCERSDITKHMLIHEDPKHVCNICNRSFRHAKNKELHLKRHKGQKDYKCGVCEFYGYTFTDIRKHIERRHADPQTILCDRCGQAFKTQALLKEHEMSAQCEVYLIEQELTEYEETAPEGLLAAEPADRALEETFVEADGQLLGLPGHQYAIVTTAGDEADVEATSEVPDVAHETHIAVVQEDASHLLV